MTFLADILSRKRAEVDARRGELPDRELLSRARDLPPARSLFAALSPPSGPVAIWKTTRRGGGPGGASVPCQGPSRSCPNNAPAVHNTSASAAISLIFMEASLGGLDH